MLYSSECWALRQEHKECLEYGERAMLLWMFNIKKERVSTNSLLSQSKLKSLDSVLKCNRLPWLRNVKCSSELDTRQILDLEVEGNKSRGRPKKSWLDAIKDGLRQWKLQTETCQNGGNDWKLLVTHMLVVT